MPSLAGPGQERKGSSSKQGREKNSPARRLLPMSFVHGRSLPTPKVGPLWSQSSPKSRAPGTEKTRASWLGASRPLPCNAPLTHGLGRGAAQPPRTPFSSRPKEQLRHCVNPPTVGVKLSIQGSKNCISSFVLLFSGCAQALLQAFLCLSSGAQGLGESYGMQSIEPGLAACKAHALPAVLSGPQGRLWMAGVPPSRHHCWQTWRTPQHHRVVQVGPGAAGHKSQPQT